MSRSQRARRGFTLLELLIVIAILTVLAAILFPVLAQGRERARRASCLSNGRQLGLAFLQYAQDFDEYYPLTVHAGENFSWTQTIDPYLRNKQVFRCPADLSANWSAPVTPRKTSYFLNVYMRGTGAYGKLSSVMSPANVIYIAESADDRTDDHFHPTQWGRATNFAWNAARDETTEIALRRHQGGFNAVYADGHCKWARWDMLWKSGAATLQEKLGPFHPGD
jgi:prepilin-type N-terminal cleavage/methylation domain-containing protein/prepilin-type processing-associated H-X9-DG protein